jgi:hypothetical protein
MRNALLKEGSLREEAWLYDLADDKGDREEIEAELEKI